MNFLALCPMQHDGQAKDIILAMNGSDTELGEVTMISPTGFTVDVSCELKHPNSPYGLGHNLHNLMSCTKFVADYKKIEQRQVVSILWIILLAHQLVPPILLCKH
jgi:hypothetical protein